MNQDNSCNKDKKKAQWDKYFSIEEIENFASMKNIEGKHIKHPIIYLLENEGTKNTYNTKNSFDVVYNKNIKYLDKMKNKMIGETNFSNVNGILGEIRCYGYLLEAFNDDIILNCVKTENNKETPDFEIYNKEKEEKVYIEVNTKQHNDEESKRLQKFNSSKEDFVNEIKKQNSQNHRKVNIHTRYIAIAPFGRSSDHVNIDVIQKIAQTKKNKYQIPNDSIGIIWIDLHSEGITNMIGLEQAEPLYYSWRNGMFSGVLWYGIYGKKGLPIFNNTEFHPAYKGLENFNRMKHDGLCIQRTDVAAVVVSDSDYTCIFENPFSERELPMWFLESFITVPRFNYEHSRIRFPKYNIRQELKNQYKRIDDLSKIPSRSF